MRQKIFLLFALLCAIVQGAWAQNYDVWDGSTKTKPTEIDGVIHITNAAELAYLSDNFNSIREWNRRIEWVRNYDGHGAGYRPVFDYAYTRPISLDADIDMGDAVSWAPLGRVNAEDHYEGTFYGNGHTIRIHTTGATDNYQGLFTGIASTGRVENLHVVADIHCSSSRLVGGIAGENDGTIENCWVSGTVRSDWKEPSSAYTAKVGGIAGENNGTIQYCCVTANVQNDDADVGGIVGDNSGHTISHCTFYGTRTSAHTQDNDYAGDDGTEEYCYTTFNQSEYNTASGRDMYRYAIKYPYTINVKNVGLGSVQVSAGGETGITRWYPQGTITLTKTTIPVSSVTITDADGNNVTLQGQANDNSSFWFVMPKKEVTVTVTYDYANWPTQGAGTEADPYIISNAEDWHYFAHNVTLGRSYSGKVIKLTNNISVSHMAGGYLADDNYQPFSGTFDGYGHTLTLNVSNQARFAAPFKCISSATIKNLRTAGTINGTGNSDGKLLAGLVGVSFGNTTISGCVSSVTLTTDFGEDAALAGLVAGTKGGNLTIEGCVFDGSMTGATNTRCAGISGYEYGGTTTSISDCLFAPATLTVSTADDSYTKTISRDADATITNCYYTQTLGTAQGTQAIASGIAPSSGGDLVKDYGMVKAYEQALWFNDKYYFAPTISTGSGTEGDPYIISNADQWASFAALVNNGTDAFSSKFVQLTADIEADAAVGLRGDKPFSGTFLGNGHTITANISSTTTGTGANEQGVAPFHYIKDATIKDLTVAGTIASASYHTGGLVGFADGTNTIENCTVTATLNINSNYAGGIIGHGLSSATTIRGCVFAGTINGVGGNRENIGGIWGWSNSGTPTLQNCLEAGTYTNITSMHPMGLQSGKGTITNCYYVTPQIGEPTNACTVSGAKRAIASVPFNIGDLVQDCGMVTAYEHGILYDGTYYVDAEQLIVGAGTEDAPFTISNAESWQAFADYVNSGNTFSGQFVQLTSNISVSAMVGVDNAKSFQGTFLGDGHTLTFNNGTAESPFSEDYCAPFRHVKGATIKNLHVAGTIYTSAKKAAGIVGESHGNLTITGCRSSIAISSSVSGDGTHGGLVSTLSGAGNIIIIDGCLFDGSFATTAGTNNCGGFVGWPVWNRPTIKNSLMKPSSVDAGMLINTFARRHDGYEPTITNCYYVATDNLPTNQGLGYSFDTALANIGTAGEAYTTSGITPYTNGLLYDGRYYMTPEAISLADTEANDVASINGFFADVTLQDRTLYKDGAWNTICLPFDVTIAGSPLAGATARPLTSASISGSTLTLTFGDAVTTLEAGTPYIIKWASGDNIVSPVFSGVTIDADADGNYDTETASPAVTTDERVRFLGTYKSTTFDAEDKSILLMGGANTLYYPKSGAGIGAQRAYFKIGDDGALLARRLTAFNIDFGDDEATGIISLSTDSKDSKDNAAWYSLDGRKLQGKPSRAGVYINNGIKIVIK